MKISPSPVRKGARREELRSVHHPMKAEKSISLLLVAKTITTKTHGTQEFAQVRRRLEIPNSKNPLILYQHRNPEV